MTDEPQDAERPPLVLEAFGCTGDVKLRVPPEDTAELRDLLAEAGVPFSTGAEFSQGPVMDLLVATVQEPAIWTALGGVITGYLSRNTSRSVKTRDVHVEGYNHRQALRIIEALRAEQNRNDETRPS